MSYSRMPFEEAVKRLRISCLPMTVRRRLALHLDTYTNANWEYLAEVLKISTLEIRWLKDTAVHSHHGSPTFRLFDQHLVKSDMALEEFICALEKIKNLACIHVLTEEYDNGSFDRELVGICNPTTILHHPPEIFNSLHRCQTSPICSSAEYQRKLYSRTYIYDPSDGNCSSGSTYNSLDGVAGDSISFTQLDSCESGEYVPEFPVPMNTGIILGETRLPTLGHEEGLYTVDCTRAANMTQDAALDLSRYNPVKAEPLLKEEHGHCCNVRQNGFDKNSCRPCPQAPHVRNELLQKKQDVCAGHLRLCPHVAPSTLHKPLVEDMKAEGISPASNHSPVMMEMKMENGGRNPRKEDPDGAGKGNDICCNCLSRSQWSDQKGMISAAEAGAICMREPSPGSALHHPSKRATDPLSKEELESLEKEKQQTNSDEATPVRITKSSYAVLQQKPFRKDSRSIRVFVTYSDDSKRHMKKVMQLCECLKNNNFSVSIDVREHHLLSQDKMGWFDKRFKVADYVLVLISPKYYTDVTGPDDGLETQQNESTLNTLYIHRCMQAEYMMNKCLNKRFVPVLMPGSTKDHVPCWLKNTTIYLWPDQYKNLLFYMMYPAQVISQFVRREQSAKTPTVIKTSH